MNQKEISETMDRLDKAYPHGWKSGNSTTDFLTVSLAFSLGKFFESVFSIDRK